MEGGKRNKHKRRALFSGNDDKNTYFWTFWMFYFPSFFLSSLSSAPLPPLCLHLWLLAIYYILSRLHLDSVHFYEHCVIERSCFSLVLSILSLLYFLFMCTIGVGGSTFFFSGIRCCICSQSLLVITHIYASVVTMKCSLLFLARHFCVSLSELPLPRTYFITFEVAR